MPSAPRRPSSPALTSAPLPRGVEVRGQEFCPPCGPGAPQRGGRGRPRGSELPRAPRSREQGPRPEDRGSPGVALCVRSCPQPALALFVWLKLCPAAFISPDKEAGVPGGKTGAGPLFRGAPHPAGSLPLTSGSLAPFSSGQLPSPSLAHHGQMVLSTLSLNLAGKSGGWTFRASKRHLCWDGRVVQTRLRRARPLRGHRPGPAPSAWVPPVGSSSSLASFSLILLSGRE